MAELFRDEDYSLAWTAHVTVAQASMDRLQLAASWERFVRDRRGKPRLAAEESIPTLGIREGERVLLDYAVPAESGRPPCARNYALELKAAIHEDPAMASRQIVYDLWLVHEARDSRKRTGRIRLTAKHGDKSPFAFPDQALPAVAGARRAETLRVAVSGHVRGRVRSDGTVELALDTNRSLSYVTADGSSDGGVGEGGKKIVRVQPGEAIRVELPVPDRGPASEDPRVPDMAQDLAGHTFAVIFRASPR